MVEGALWAVISIGYATSQGGNLLLPRADLRPEGAVALADQPRPLALFPLPAQFQFAEAAQMAQLELVALAEVVLGRLAIPAGSRY